MINIITYFLSKQLIKMQQTNKDEQATCGRGSTHQRMPIMMICLEKNCNRKRLCCLSCIDELHIKHELMSLKKFYKYVEQTTNYNSSIKDKEETIKTIELAQKSMLDSLQKVKNAFDSKINEISNKIRTHFQQIKESFIHEKLKNVCENIRDEFTDQKIEQYYQLIKKAQGNLSRPLDEIKKLVTITEKAVNDKVVSFVKQIDKNVDNIAKDVLQFKIAKNNGNKAEFNEQTKSPFLTISEAGKIAKRTDGSGGYPIAVVKQQFSPQNHTVSFKITEQLGAKGIWMGVCVLDVVKNLNYQSCYGIGKGTWGIDQVGENHTSAYSWSHHDTNYNSCPKVGWQFWVGDLVEISVDFDKSVARFCKNKQFFYEQPIKLDLGPVYAFAGPTHLNDSISIV